MKPMFKLLVFTLCSVAFTAHADTGALLMPDGTVRLDAAGDCEIEPLLLLPGWHGAKAKGGWEIATPGVAPFRFVRDGQDLMDVKVELSQLDGGKALVRYAFVAKKDLAFQTLGCAMHFAAADVGGLGWRVGEKRGRFEHLENGDIVLHSGKNKSFAFPLARSGKMLHFASVSPVHYLIQDNKRWSDTYSIRIGLIGERRMAKGETVRFSFVLSSDGPLKAESSRPYVVSAGEDWIAADYRRDIEKGSALDFSGMGFTDAPAGKYGWIRNVGGHFEFEGLPGKPKRFYGVNLCGTANYPDYALAETLVARFKRTGYNSIRVHHHDAASVEGSDDGVTLNPANMDRLDYLIAAAIREGLYITTDIFVSRRIKWRHIGVDRDGTVDMQLFKALCATYEPAFSNWTAYAKNFLLHRNRYTGRRYIDEPALPLISLVNEGGFFMGWGRGVRDDPRIVASWKAWLAGKRAADPSFAPGMSPDSLPEDFWARETRPFLEEWAGGLEAKMVARMKAYLRELGSKALITNDNCGPHYTARNGMAADYDYIDDHFYVDHPSFLDKRWRLPSRCPNVNQLLGDGRIMPLEYDFPRVEGKPFTITEWNFSGPGRYRGVGGILTGATAALRDLDGLWRFAYSHSRDRLGDADVKPPSYFDLAGDPLSQTSDRASICLFLRGDMPPKADSRLKIDRKRGSFTIDTPRTCGGFAPEGDIDAGVLKARVSGAPATVCAHSLDGAAIARSGRILLTHLTDVQGDGAKFADGTMKILLKGGGRPIVRNGAAQVELAIETPEAFSVWELATSGKRCGRMPAAVSNGRLAFTATVKGPNGARMLYEIAK